MDLEKKKKKKDYLFPFSTCEKPYRFSKIIAQPWSTFFNAIGTLIVLFFLVRTKKWYPFLFLLSIFFFEAFHTFSHAVHLQNFKQVNVLHILAYISIVFLFLSFYTNTNTKGNSWIFGFIILLSLVDFYSFLYLPFIYYFTTLLILFITIMVYFYSSFSSVQKSAILKIIGITFVIVGLVYNEKFNSERMLDWMPDFPFHIFVEIFGAIAFYLIGDFFQKL